MNLTHTMTPKPVTGLGKPISPLVLGSMVCSTDQLDDTFALLEAWTTAGGNAIDTAKVYGPKSERAIGEWMRTRNNREQIFLIGKGAHHDANGPRVHPAAIAEDLTQSLEHFQTDYVDLYLLHRDDPSVPVGPIVDALNAHKAAGQVRAFGGSNWTTARIQEANDYAKANGLTGFAASSPHLSLARTNGPMWTGCVTLDAEGKAWHQQQQFPLLPWSAQAGGFFTGRYSPDDHSNADVERIYYSADNWERLARAREMAQAKGVTSNNIALAYVLHQPFPIFPLIGPRSVAELTDSLPALDVTLNADEMRYLNLETPNGA